MPPTASEEQALGQQLADDARAAGAERQADADLVGSRGGAPEQQGREIAARDQQHDSDRGHQDEHGSFEARLQLGNPAAARRDADARASMAGFPRGGSSVCCAWTGETPGRSRAMTVSHELWARSASR